MKVRKGGTPLPTLGTNVLPGSRRRPPRHDLRASAAGVQEIEEHEFERLMGDEAVMREAEPLANRMDLARCASRCRVYSARVACLYWLDRIDVGDEK